MKKVSEFEAQDFEPADGWPRHVGEMYSRVLEDGKNENPPSRYGDGRSFSRADTDWMKNK